MKFTGKTSKIVLAAAISGSLMLPASAAFAGDKTERALLGGLLGAAAGASVTGGDTEGVVIGAAAGSVLGVATAKKKYPKRYRSSRAYYQDRGYSDRSYYKPAKSRYYYDDYRHGYYRY
jgi:hypothetical protein